MKKIRSVVCCALMLQLFLLTIAGCASNTASTGSTVKSSSVAESTSEDTSSEAVNYDDMSLANILSYNVYYKDVQARAANIIDLIKKGAADVIGLQEVSVDWQSYLNEAFVNSGDYGYYGFGRYGGEWNGSSLQSGEQFSLILYKTEKYELVKSGHFWCSSTPDIYSAQWTDGIKSEFPRCINWVMLKDKVTGDEFVFVDAHLDPDNETVRVYSAQLIVQKMTQIAEGRLCVMVGDWNSGLTKPSYAQITSNGFSDVRSIAVETTKIGTFNDWGKREKTSWAFGDIIFASKGLAQVKKFNVLDDTYDGEYMSDHCPVVAEIYY